MTGMTIKEKYPCAPRRIRETLQGKTMIEIHIGCSKTHVYKVLNGDHGVFLKTHVTSAFFSFAHEVRILKWLHRKLPVPEVIEYERDSSHEYLILTEIPGESCVEAMRTHDYKRLVFLLATGLHIIHKLDISTCPFDERIAEKLKKALDNVNNNLVDENDFDEERSGMTAREVYQALQHTCPPEDDLVFTHGDYCLPNILLQNDAVSGFIDLDRAGISDKYNDLAIASRSIRYNLGAKYEQLFYECYGIDHVDEERIAYYRMMDELF